MKTKLEKDVRFLKIYAALATAVCAVLLLTGFADSKKKKFEEIDVERINVVQKDGKLKMVLSNDEKSPDVVAGGKVLKANRNQGGLYLYNDLGEEAGGLVAGGKIENGKVVAGSQLSLDQFQQDQTIRLSYEDNNGRRRAALVIQDRSNIFQPEWNEKYAAVKKMKDGADKDAALKPLLNPYRVYVGKTIENGSAVLLYDKDGNPRIMMIVGENGQPKLDFLDEKGNVIQSFPTVQGESKK
ncbi:MAG: hypothetical protein ABWZ66_01590 [Pyrinomonadaceae bacterium]